MTTRLWLMSGVSPTTFYQTIKYVYEPVVDILEEQFRDAIADMKAMGDKEQVTEFGIQEN